MKTELRNEYTKMRQAKPFMLVGEDARCSLDAARTVLAFRSLELQGRVRIRAEAEEENYFDVYGEYDADVARYVENWGAWWVLSEYRADPCECCGEDKGWEQADSIGMCIYENPTSEYENCYVIDLMAEAVRLAS